MWVRTIALVTRIASSQHMVGRTRAVETVERALAAARAEQPIHLVISGEAGVGKTRLLEYAGASAAEQGMRCLSGSCFDLGASSLPYAPYADLLRDLIAEDGLPAIRQMAGRDARDLSRLVPALADAQAEADATPEPQRIFEAIRSLLRKAARGRALLVGLEDSPFSRPRHARCHAIPHAHAAR